ncbi:unnamed protein product [Malus baccata var. baccata]
MPTQALITRSMESSRGAIRYLSSGKGKILSEEERAAENVYIQVQRRGRYWGYVKENADKKARRSFAMFDHSKG